MIRQKSRRFSVFVLAAVSLWLMAYSLFMMGRTMETVRTALYVFAQSILPSLAVFSVCSKIFLKTNVAEKISFPGMKAFLEPLGMTVGGFFAFLTGLFAGFPTGASMLADLCEQGEMSKREAESLLPFCNHAGVAFLVGTVGEALFGDAKMGMILFFAQTATAWCCLCLTAGERVEIRESKTVRNTPEMSFFFALSASVRESAFAMLSVCGFVVFFSLAVTAFFDTLLVIGFPLGSLMRAAVGGFFEISFGFITLSSFDLSTECIGLLGGVMLGFGGISVFVQAMERTENIFCSPRKYFVGKMLESVICPLFVFIFSFLYEKENGKKSIIAFLVFVFCIFYLLNCLKIKFFSKKCGKIERNAV